MPLRLIRKITFLLVGDVRSPPASVASESMDLNAIEDLQRKIDILSQRLEKIQKEVARKEEEQEYSDLNRISKMSVKVLRGLQPKSTGQTKENIKVQQQGWYHDLNSLRDQEPIFQAVSGTKFKILKQPTVPTVPSTLDLITAFGFFKNVILEQGTNSERKTVYRLLYLSDEKSVTTLDGSLIGLSGIFLTEKDKHFHTSIEWVSSHHDQADKICSSLSVVFNKASLIETGRRQNFKSFDRLFSCMCNKEYCNINGKIIVSNAPPFLIQYGRYVLHIIISYDSLIHNFASKVDADEKAKISFKENPLHVIEHHQRQAYNQNGY